MLDRLLAQGTIPILEKAASFAARRHEVLANNVANADTVFYRARDLPVKAFREQLERSIERRHRRKVPVFRFEESPEVRSDRWGGVRTVEVPSPQGRMLFHDKNDRAIEIEMAKMAKNAGHYSAMIELLKKQFRMLDMAIAGRIR